MLFSPPVAYFNFIHWIISLPQALFIVRNECKTLTEKITACDAMQIELKSLIKTDIENRHELSVVKSQGTEEFWQNVIVYFVHLLCLCYVVVYVL